MKPSSLLKLFLAVTTISSIFSAPSVLASSFGETEVDRERFAVVAAPYHHGYNLLILEQIPGQRPCWNEIGANPTIIEPLFLEFDFTNSCIRSSDSNSYSIRFNGEDYGLDYLLNIVEKEGELHLIGTPRDSSKPELYLGKTNGLSSGSLKIELDSGWRLTKRTYNGAITAHLYLSNSSHPGRQSVSELAVSNDANSQNSTNSQVRDRQPVYYPQQQPTQQPVYNSYQQPVYYPRQQPTQQPVYNDYQQPIYYPQQQPTQQPVYNGYQQPVYYPQQQPTQQPVYNGYQQPAYYPQQQPTQQPPYNGYQQSVTESTRPTETIDRQK